MSELESWIDEDSKEIAECTIQDLITQVKERDLLITELKARVARLEEVSREVMKGMTANAMTERAFMAEITSLRDVLSESPSQSLALHDVEIIDYVHDVVVVGRISDECT